MRFLFAVSSWFVQRAPLTVHIHLSDVIYKYYTVLYRTVVVYEKNNKLLVFSDSRKTPTLGSTIQWETRQASFPTGTVGPGVGIFLSPLNTYDAFYLSYPAILPSLSREGYIYWLYWHSRTWSSSDVIVMFSDVIMYNCILVYSETSGSLFKKKEQWWARKIIYYSCEGMIEKSVPRDHRLSSSGKPRDAKRWSWGLIFLSYPNTHDRFL